jgi:hypothetical protein
MTTLSDWQDRYGRLSDGILQLQNLVESSVNNTRGTNDLIKAVSKLEQRKAVLQSKEKDYEQKAATFDRDFLEKKADFPDPFVPNKLYTIQDFLFFFFFVSYCIFILAVSLSFPSSQGKILIGGFILLLLIYALIIRYA